MPNEPLRVGNIGVDIQVHLTENGNDVDLSSSSARYIYLRFQDGRYQKKFTGTLVSGGTTGRMKYTTASADDLPVPGPWHIQAFFTNASGTFSSKFGLLHVDPNLY